MICTLLTVSPAILKLRDGKLRAREAAGFLKMLASLFQVHKLHAREAAGFSKMLASFFQVRSATF
jgi:hypothetical protein